MKNTDEEDIRHLTKTVHDLFILRKKRYTQAEVAERMGTVQGRVSDFEKMLWQDNIKVSTLMLYARAIGKKIQFTIEDE